MRDLPDAAEAERFLARIVAEHAPACRLFERDAGLLADALALAAWSPFLAGVLTQHPEYLAWLARVRLESSVRNAEELGESLARFAATNTALPIPVLLARFRRRELLRIYLRDIRHTATLVETTDELSSLADAVLAYALGHARQELENLYGAPLCTDERGRTATADFCIVALGKLGSRELNYASDIDLLYLYSGDGATSGTGTRGVTTNREYFIKLATRVSSLVGGTSSTGSNEGAAYRVDLRLRPHGRDGVLAPSLSEAARYYCGQAHRWELQALIRSRASAGASNVFDAFVSKVRNAVYRQGESVADALAHVRQGKSKIDQQHGGEAGGYNVKLGSGGIREIEFIAQALQLAYGGADEWLRAGHTLVSLGRLRDRRLVSDHELTVLSDAYIFLRRVEHRVQMEQGLQTHRVSEDHARRTTLALRMSFSGASALTKFDHTLEAHRAGVRRIFARVFNAQSEDAASAPRAIKSPHDSTPGHSAQISSSDAPQRMPRIADASNAKETQARRARAFDSRLQGATNTAAANESAAEFGRHLLAVAEPETREQESVSARAERADRVLANALRDVCSERRARTHLARVALSLVKTDAPVGFTDGQLAGLARLCGASDFFGEMFANNPSLIAALPANEAVETFEDFQRACEAKLTAAINDDSSFADSLGRLRRAHARVLVRIGAADASGQVDLRESNRRQTALAVASIDAAHRRAARELTRRAALESTTYNPPHLATLGLGRLGGGGMDYGSDLDLVLIHDDAAASPLANRAHEAAYAVFAEHLTAALSSFTRDGYLYRVDLRLRPDGKNGAPTMSRTAFVTYLRERAAAWELLAYVKLHTAAGDNNLGAQVLTDARAAMRDRAAQLGAEHLRIETRRVRERLEAERERDGRGKLDIKYGAGGMLDVYFAARFLQLRDDVMEEGEDRSTTATLARLYAAGSLNSQDHDALRDGYALLRRLDHFLRLIIGRGTRLPPAGSPALADLARCLNYDSIDALLTDLRQRMSDIRAAFERITFS